MLSWTEGSFFSFTFWMFVDVYLCSSSGKFHGILSIPNPCCSSAPCAWQDGALAHSLVPAALGSAELGLCMILINTKYVAAAQKGFIVQLSRLLTAEVCLAQGLLDALLSVTGEFRSAFCMFELLHAKTVLWLWS